MYSAEINIAFDNPEETRVIFNAVMPEIKQERFTRSKSSLYLNDKRLLLKVNAKDANAFKASINSYVKSIVLAKNILDICKEE